MSTSLPHHFGPTRPASSHNPQAQAPSGGPTPTPLVPYGPFSLTIRKPTLDDDDMDISPPSSPVPALTQDVFALQPSPSISPPITPPRHPGTPNHSLPYGSSPTGNSPATSNSSVNSLDINTFLLPNTSPYESPASSPPSSPSSLHPSFYSLPSASSSTSSISSQASSIIISPLQTLSVDDFTKANNKHVALLKRSRYPQPQKNQNIDIAKEAAQKAIEIDTARGNDLFKLALVQARKTVPHPGGTQNPGIERIEQALSLVEFAEARSFPLTVGNIAHVLQNGSAAKMTQLIEAIHSRPIHASQGAFLRAMQRSLSGSKRNIGEIKTSNEDGSRVIRLYARSMGIGNQQFQMEKERKRSHSEALLAAALRVGKLQLPSGQIIDFPFPEHRIQYVASTNSACRDETGQQNCFWDLLPELTDQGRFPFYSFNPYSGSESAGGFAQSTKDHDGLRTGTSTSKKQKERLTRLQEKNVIKPDLSMQNLAPYESDPDSDVEGAITRHYLIDDTKLRGKNIESLKAIPVIPTWFREETLSNNKRNLILRTKTSDMKAYLERS